jgi:hypothetical protein
MNLPSNIRDAFFPFIFMVIWLTVVYGFLNWLFIVRGGQFIYDLGWFDLIIPVVIALGVIRYWLVPKLAVLNFIDDGYKKRLAPIIAFLILALSMHCIQIWTGTYYYKIQHLNHIYEINNEPKKRFYEISQGYYVDKTLLSYYVKQYNCSTKYNNILYCIEIYATYPVHEKKSAVWMKKEPVSWLGISFKNESQSLSESDEFFVGKMQYLKELDPNAFYYLERMTDSNYDSDLYEAAIHTRQYPFTISKNPLILLPSYIPFSERLKYDFSNLFCTWAVGILIWFGICYLMIHENAELRKI